ncbi:MBL fold metallo-hydrolase [Scleromatobacter humisilvae]|uniref:MBL fold metallo-hydrolase n=1 Tax=Scleromatobacter humisilvae TaxID=2897159 RepID=A0A9X2C3F6_9BURK|nr:MBL fold metallo-hydrolase [Scleromatobacter humisilvae]MCK9687410.1 MBL fold metallo-hydrolase [Scleromatobacter humisilvae]
MTRLAHSFAALTLGLCAALPALAQSDPDYSKIEIKTTQLAPDFWTLEGLGGRISVLAGPDGILLVDSQFAPLTDKLVAAIRRVSDKPIRFLVDTHVHPDHVGGNANFAKLGATIFARDQLRWRLEHPAAAADGTPGKPAAEEALPVVTYNASLSIHIDGEDVRLLPVEAAHTDGDTVISFPRHDILAVGDIYRSVGYPYADLANGGSLAGILEGLSEIVDRAGPTTKIIPGHGPIVTRDAVLAQRDLIVALRGRVQKLVEEGKTLDEIIAAHPTADFDAHVPQGTPATRDRFVTWVYKEVVANR